MSSTRVILGLTLLLLVEVLGAQVTTIELHHDWRFRSAADQHWRSAAVPGCVHTDLLAAGVIPDPFVGTYEDSVQWVSERDWVYELTFATADSILNKEHINLVFEGLDTYAEVVLNDEVILQAHNAFRSWTVDVKSYLKTENRLQVNFTHPSKIEKEKAAKLNYTLPEGNRIFTRKAQYQHGWDWGPSLNTMGIWQSVHIEAWDDARLAEVHIAQSKLTDQFVDLTAQVLLEGEGSGVYEMLIIANGETLAKRTIKSKNGKLINVPFSIEKPQLWWPHNLGEPHLYDIEVILLRDGGIVDQQSMKKGIRTIELVADEDRWGQSFYFRVNGKPVYAKGANYIPMHSFPSAVSDAKYEELLDDVVSANMNMLRVWGGGIYESDKFYQLCDEIGILIWQDFMYACAMYPGDKAFLDGARAEAVEQVKRLRDHACLALWCGNNESSEGWHRWGWQSDRSRRERREIWKNYKTLFQDILPDVVGEYAGGISYWESSPKYGRGNAKYITEGDAHDWWVWHDAYPFEHFEEHVPRFMSEFGFQSFPSRQAIEYMMDDDGFDINSAAVKSHQKHRRGFELIQEYMERDYPVPQDDDWAYAYISQLVQARGMTMGIEAHRRAKPYNMGTLYWQLNDCWPVISWSSIDFLGQKKAFYYQSIRAFDDVLISSRIDDDQVTTHLINDDLSPVRDELHQVLMTFSGDTIAQRHLSMGVSANGNTHIGWDMSSLDFDRKSVVLVSEYAGRRELKYFAKPKELNLGGANIDYCMEKIGEEYYITLESSTLQKDVFIDLQSGTGDLSDNYFDLLPHEPKTIVLKSNDADLTSISIVSLNQY